jgi:hypothetical protein
MRESAGEGIGTSLLKARLNSHILSGLAKRMMGNRGTMVSNRSRCPRCVERSTIQSAVELRPAVHYLMLRCIACGLVFNAQVESQKADSIDPAG